MAITFYSVEIQHLKCKNYTSTDPAKAREYFDRFITIRKRESQVAELVKVEIDDAGNKTTTILDHK